MSKIDGRKTMPHLFKKGVGGNPNGRPKGSVNKYTQLARELLSSRGEEIVEVVIAKALKGDDEVIATIVKEEEK